jgi:hypothetical protein
MDSTDGGVLEELIEELTEELVVVLELARRHVLAHHIIRDQLAALLVLRNDLLQEVDQLLLQVARQKLSTRVCLEPHIRCSKILS